MRIHRLRDKRRKCENNNSLSNNENTAWSLSSKMQAYDVEQFGAGSNNDILHAPTIIVHRTFSYKYTSNNDTVPHQKPLRLFMTWDIMKFKQDTSIRMHTYQQKYPGEVSSNINVNNTTWHLTCTDILPLIQVLPGYLKTTRRETTDIVSPNYSYIRLLCIIALYLVRLDV